MNTNVLQKYYDQLTPRERLAALIEARARDDEQEENALGQSAPTKDYRVGHHAFFEEAFRRLADIHMLEMLDMGCAFYMGEGVIFMLEGKGDDDRAEAMTDKLVELAGTIILIHSAWRKFCEGMGIDPDKALLDLPGSGVHSPGKPDPLRSDTLPSLLKTARLLAGEEPDPAVIAELAEAYKCTLYSRAGEQSGGWG